jgi:hypothetical protein
MKPNQLACDLQTVGPQDPSVFVNVLADHVREAQLSNGHYLTLVGDFEAWLREVAQELLIYARYTPGDAQPAKQ